MVKLDCLSAVQNYGKRIRRGFPLRKSLPVCEDRAI